MYATTTTFISHGHRSRNMAKGMRLNRPKKALHNNHQKLGRVKKQQRKKEKKIKEIASVVDPLVTNAILKKRRTNPKANITLSAKKRRLLTKKLKREEVRINQMEVTIENPKDKSTKSTKNSVSKKERMDVDE